MFGRKKTQAPPVVADPLIAQTAAVIDIVTAHKARGTARHDVIRALTFIAADSLEPVIRRVVDEIYS